MGGAGRGRTWNTLEEADVEVDLVPGDGDALDLEKGQSDGGLPVLGGLGDEVVEGVAEHDVLSDEGVGLHRRGAARERRRQRRCSGALVWGGRLTKW